MFRPAMVGAAVALASITITDALAAPGARLGRVRPLAAAKIPVLNGTTKIRRRSIRGDRLLNNTLTGTQINETRLGTVPKAGFAASAATAASADTARTAGSAQSAQSAQNAESAVNASRLGGKEIVPLLFNAPPGTGNTLLGQVGPLQLYAACASNGTASVAASSSAG